MVEKIEALRPLFASIRGDFANLPIAFEKTFWKIGKNLVNLTYKNTLIDPRFKPAESDSEEDEIEVLFATARKISAIAPVIQPNLLNPILAEARKYCIKALENVTTALQFDPLFQLQNEELKPAPGNEENDEDFPWLMKFIPVEDGSHTKKTKEADAIPIQDEMQTDKPTDANPIQEETKTNKPTDVITKESQEETLSNKPSDVITKESQAVCVSNNDMGISAVDPHPLKVKRRLVRRVSEWGEKNKVWNARNFLRNQTVDTVKQILNLIVDAPRDEVKLTDIITSLTLRYAYPNEGISPPMSHPPQPLSN